MSKAHTSGAQIGRCVGNGHAAAPGAADWLCLAAAPTGANEGRGPRGGCRVAGSLSVGLEIDALQVQRQPAPQYFEGQISGDELAGIRCCVGAVGKPHGMAADGEHRCILRSSAPAEPQAAPTGIRGPKAFPDELLSSWALWPTAQDWPSGYRR